MSTGNQKFPRIKLLGIRATISVTREMRETILKGEDFIGFVMRDVIGDKIRFIDKKNRPLK